MIRIWLVFARAIAVVAVFQSVAVSAAEPSSAANDTSVAYEPILDDLVPLLLEQNKVPGAAVVIIDEDQTIFLGYGVRRAKSSEVIGPDTVFEAASLGKPVFAYAMLMEMAAGRLRLDRPLLGSPEEPYVKDDDRLRLITARHVLSHTTGFPNWRPERFSARPKSLQILRDPGAEFGYSGEGYMYLQGVAEQSSGAALDTFMQKSVFLPLRMKRSSYLWSDLFEGNFATPHGYWGQEGEKWRSREAGSAYSLHTTAADFARFLEAMLDESNETARAMLVPQINLTSSEDHSWSLGWGIERRPDGDWFWHWGDNSGFKHFVMGSRTENRAVLVMTNARRGAHVYRAVVEAVLGFLPKALDLKYIRY